MRKALVRNGFEAIGYMDCGGRGRESGDSCAEAGDLYDDRGEAGWGVVGEGVAEHESVNRVNPEMEGIHPVAFPRK